MFYIRNIMKLELKSFLLIAALTVININVFSQSAEMPPKKKETRHNLVIKEYKTDAKGGDRVLEQEIKYDENGYKIEEIEYATYGMKGRITFEYDSNGRCIKEVSYDDRNKVSRVRKIEYNDDGTKKAHYNYLPNGRLYSTKQYEYSYK